MGSKLTLSIFSLSHLVVDLACFFVLMGSFFSGVDNLPFISMGFLLYNAIAFALQLPIGYLADRLHPRNISHGLFAVVGCLVVILGVLLPASPWVCLALCAFGNAFFHVGGGIDSLILANGRYARSGIFISFGAIGVVLGTLAGKEAWLSPLMVSLMLLACAVLILRFCRQTKTPYETAFVTHDSRKALLRASEAVILLCMLAIVMRAAVGTYTPIPWKSTTFLIILPVLAVFAGKFAGGILADRFGPRLVASVSLIIAAPLLAFGNSQIVLGCIGLFLFNVTTAVTLCVIASRLPQYPGFSFGLTTLALFVGSTFSFFWAMPESLRPVLTIAMIFISVVCVILTTPGKASMRGKSDDDRV